MTGVADLVQVALRQVDLERAAEEERQVELSDLERWARDPVGWINAFVWIASKFGGSRNRVRPMRMILFPDQETTVAAWIDLEHLRDTGELVFRNIVVEKSRQIGETWLFAVVMLWALLFHPVQGLAIHRKGAEIADRGFTIKSLFGKIRYAYRRLPPGSFPPTSVLAFHPFSLDPAKVTNEHTGATWHGEPQSDDPGRGGTFDAVLVDEAAFVRHGEAVYAAIDEACPEGKALLSTPFGSDNFHARLADEEPEGWRYLRLHWSTHPRYALGLHVAGLEPDRQPTPAMADAADGCELCAGNRAGFKWNSRAPRAHRFPGKLTSPHYDRAVIGKTVEQVASELDIDREKSLTGRVYDEFASEIHVYRGADGREAEIPFDPDLPLELGWDYGLDCTAIIVCQDHPLEYRVIGEVEVLDRPGETPIPSVVAPLVRQELIALGVEARFATPAWTRRIYARGDPSGDHRSLSTGRPLTTDYRVAGFNISRPPSYLTRRVEDSIKAVKALLLGEPKPLVVSARCQRFIRHARQNRWPTDAQGAKRIGVTTPFDDEHNHMMRAFAYLVVSKFPPRKQGGGIADPWDSETREREESPLERRRRRALRGDETPPPLPYGSPG